MRREMIRSSPPGPELPSRMGVVQGEEHTRLHTGVLLVHQHRAPLQEAAVAFQGEIEDSVEEGVPRTDELGQGLALGGQVPLVEGDALVAPQHRSAGPGRPLAVAHRGRHVGDLVPAFLPPACGPPSRRKPSRKKASM